MAEAVSDNIFAKCLPALSTDIERCGGATLCSISPTRENELEDIYKDSSDRWRIIGSILESDIMGKACQIVTNGMYDWIQANRKEFGAKRLTASKIAEGRWSVQPFVLIERHGPINNEFWNVTSGVAGAGTYNGEAYDYTALVASQSSIPANTQWFPPRLRVSINGTSAGGSATRTEYSIVASVLSGSNVRIYALANNASSFLDPAKVETPATGWLTRGTPNVQDVESYCPQIPGLNTTQLNPSFIETTRWAICEDDQTLKYINYLVEGNPLYKKFVHVPQAILNRQILEDFQRRDAWSFFFNKPLPHQTMNEWNQLEQVLAFSDTGTSDYLYLPWEGECMGRRAAATGIYEQHAECGSVYDLQNQILNIPELGAALYSILRYRQDNRIPVKMGKYGPIIEMYTDTYYASQLAVGFLRYINLKGEGLIRLNEDITRTEPPGPSQNPFGFFFQAFAMDYPICEVRIVTHKMFDDIVTAATAAGQGENIGRMLWILEWSTNYRAVIESNSQTNKSGDINTLAAVNARLMCTMKVPQRTQKMNSMSYTNVVECPRASLLMENINSDIPEHTAKVGNYSDYYGNA